MLSDVENTNLLIAKYLIENYDFIILNDKNREIIRIENEIIALGFKSKLVYSDYSKNMNNSIILGTSITRVDNLSDLLIYTDKNIAPVGFKVSFKLISKYIDSEQFDINKAINWKLYKIKITDDDHLHNFKFLERAVNRTIINEIKTTNYVFIVDYKGVIKHYLMKSPILFNFLKKIRNKLL
jgi:hypothetical protein